MNLKDFEDFLIIKIQELIPEKHLREACLYSITAGGKRLRPRLVLEFSKLFDGNKIFAYHVACAIEFIHCYSLIHDDLPAMDNDDMRRGKPTLHKQYNEAVAILAGDTLLTMAFEVLTLEDAFQDPYLVCKMVKKLANYAGANGMIQGQYRDMKLTPDFNANDLSHILDMQYKKTGALLTASCLLGAMSAGCKNEDIYRLIEEYGYYIGIAFQLRDDILDRISDAQTLGKNVNKDIDAGKITFIDRLGFEETENMLQDYIQKALNILEEVSNIQSCDITDLKELTLFILERKN